jgi:hypothetical protein
MLKVRISDDVIVEFIELFEKVRENKFAIGDRLINLVEMHGGDKASVINELAGNLNISASVLYDYYRTAEKWSPAMREIYQSLDFSFYRNTDPNNPKDLELLDRAIDEDWNVTTFKENKYPSMKAPKVILEKIKAMLVRNKAEWRPEISGEIDAILRKIDSLLRLYT